MNGLHAATTVDGLQENIELVAARLASFSARRGIVLNSEKTQVMGPPTMGPVQIGNSLLTPSITMDLLGIIFDYYGRFKDNNNKMAKELAKRVGAIRHLLPHISRGPLLREIGQAIVIGKASYGSWITRKARVTDETNTGQRQQSHIGQIALNDLARVLTGHSRKDHISIIELASKAKLPTLNEVVVKRASLEAWKAKNGGALSDSIINISSNTRASTQCLVRPSSESIVDKNLSECWNSSENLRKAATKNAARTAAKQFSSEMRFL